MRALSTDPYTVLKHNRITSDNSPLSSVKNLPSTLQVKRETILRSPQTLTHICRIPSPFPSLDKSEAGGSAPSASPSFSGFWGSVNRIRKSSLLFLHSFESTREDKTCRGWHKVHVLTCDCTDQPLQDHTKLNLLKME